MSSPDWRSTAIVINYDDSDGWYDHAYSGVTTRRCHRPTTSPNTTLSGGHLGPVRARARRRATPLAGEQGRCGFGPRLPMLVLSPFAKSNYVDHDLSNQASTINFVEYNWQLPGIAGSFDQAQAKVDKAEHVPFDLAGMFEFGNRGSTPALPLNPNTGQPVPAEYGG